METALFFIVFGLVTAIAFMYSNIRQKRTDIKVLKKEVERLQSIIKSK